jgi:phospholipase C
MFQHAAQTDRLNNASFESKLPTIWDRLKDAGVSCRYYYNNVPFLAMWGSKYKNISSLFPQFAKDVEDGNLPAVSFVDPRFTTGNNGLGNDDHPNADMRSGEIFLRDVATTLMNSRMWDNTVLVINRDEWGGFFDHVVPPRVIAPNSLDKDLVDGKALLGCRLPTLVISPFSRGNPVKPRINSLLFDHTSVLKMIEWRFGLHPLTARDASNEVANLAMALDLRQPDTSIPDLPVIPEPKLGACVAPKSASADMDADMDANDESVSEAVLPRPVVAGTDEETNDFMQSLKSGLTDGWPLPPDMI